MGMLYCRKCGAAMFLGEDLAQNILDRANETAERAKRCPGRYRAALLQEAAGYRSMYKALMHNITKREYAEKVLPSVLKALTDEIKSRNLMTEEEIQAVCEKGKERAKAQQYEAEKEEQRIYLDFETACNRSKTDSTADAAIANVERERRRGR